MAGKNISDMSFDEFFLGKKEGPKASGSAKAPEKTETQTSEVDGSGFLHGRPKLNVRGDRISLFVPKYQGGRGAKYEVSVEQDGNVHALGRLKSSPLDSDVSSIPTEFDILEAGIDPLGRFMLAIDGKDVYEMFEHSMLMFNADGMPISRAEDTTVVLYRSDKHLWVVDAKPAASLEIGGLRVDTVEVGPGGYVRVRDKPQQTAAPEKKPKTEAKKPKVKPSATISLSAPETCACVVVKGKEIPLYSDVPEISVDVKDADPEECIVRVEAPGRKDDVPKVSFGQKAAEGAAGDVTVSVVFGGKALASKRFFVIPGFSCDYAGKGDIPSDELLTFSIGGEEYRRSIYEDGLGGPYPFCGGKVELKWNIPVAMYDIGDGMKPFREEGIQVDELPDWIVMNVRGASKKAVFIGGAGKKVNLTPDWDDDIARIDTTPVRNAVFESPTREVSLYITVNSFPVRRFLKVENTAGMTASYSHGDLTVTVSGVGKHVCRVYNIDKTVETRELASGENIIAVGPGAISAEVAEVRDGREIAVESIEIRSIPFLLKDQMGDVWFYVSKDKRIPLPDGLLRKEGADPAEVRKWHSQIIRMNPELKKVSPEMTVKAFKDFSQ